VLEYLVLADKSQASTEEIVQSKDNPILFWFLYSRLTSIFLPEIFAVSDSNEPLSS